jgi:hypothetical protein
METDRDDNGARQARQFGAAAAGRESEKLWTRGWRPLGPLPSHRKGTGGGAGALAGDSQNDNTELSP